MAKCDRGDAGFRLWPLFSAASLRRRLLEALMCGGVSRPRRRRGGGRGCAAAATAFSSPKPRPRSDRLAELLRAEASESGSDEAAEATATATATAAAEEEARRKVEALAALQRVVRRLHVDGDGGDRRREAAEEVRRLTKDDAEARETLAMLGAIPPLIGMLDADDLELRIAALYALLNLGIGNDMNKAAIVKAGAVHKMLGMIGSPEDEASPSPSPSASVSEAIVANFLSLSALDSNKPIIGSSGAIPFLVRAFQNPNPNPNLTPDPSGSDALRALFNLSIAASNAPRLVDAGLVPALLAAAGDADARAGERALATLANLVAAAPEGRRAVGRSAAEAFPILVDALGWCDAPGCQDKAAYVLMVMAHKGRVADRAAMADAGVVSALLELTLLGSALAQKRASRTLEILRVDKGKEVSGSSAVSAPLAREEEGEGEGEKRGRRRRRRWG
uniref:Uncharacterized protein n=1 Tax=Ananas comosus var. bracteatus TaxID=296719 RepID=A0A6V7P4A5_ANACO|nr:unnamed protein product [Ananas comosus var. bracteatus]